MFGGKTQSAQKPTALGTMLQASTYGMATPQIYGTTLATILAIWAQNLRQGSCGKKGKKKGVQCFAENMDFLIAANPVECALQVWNNTTKYPLDFLPYRVAPGAGVQSVTIPDPNFYKLIAVSAELSLVTPITFDCFGAPGPLVFSGGGGTGSVNASVIANSPQFAPGGGSFGGISPSIQTLFPVNCNWVFGRQRGAGLSVWNGFSGGRMWAIPAGLAPGCQPNGTPTGLLTWDAIIGNCSCGGVGIVPGITLFGGCGGVLTETMGDGSGQVSGNVQSSALTGFSFDMETLGINVTNYAGFTASSCGWTGSAPIGPCTLDGMTFPGPGTGPLYQDGHNLGDEIGGQIFMLEFTPVDPSNGVRLFVAVVPGARPI